MRHLGPELSSWELFEVLTGVDLSRRQVVAVDQELWASR